MTDSERIKQLEQELAQYKLNGAIGLYYELNRFVNDTVSILREKGVKSFFAKNDDDPKMFERMMALIKNAKEHVIEMETIKNKLGLTGDEEKDRVKKPFIDRIAEKRD
jgi:nitrogen fixation/metabolism regulation signal transduction histidine kinase